MKLKTNGNHKKCVFNHNHKVFKSIKIGGLFLGVSIFSGATFGSISYYDDLETVVSVSSDERKSIYKDNLLLDFDKYIENSQGTTDTSITIEILENVTRLKLDLLCNKNLSSLDKYPNLVDLFISNAQELSSDDIYYINSHSVKNIHLIFNYDEIRKTPQNKFDLDCFENKNISVDEINNNELDNVLLLNYLENLPDNVSNEFVEYQPLDENLEEIINSLDISNTDNLDEFLKILYYVTRHIRYDNEVNFFIKVQANLDIDSTYYNKVYSYNCNSLSSVINDKIHTVQDGICINYADLLTALCYKAGIEAYTVCWNVVKIDDIYQYVDPTLIDNNNNISLYLYKYVNAKESHYKDKLKHLVLNDIDINYIDTYGPNEDLNVMLEKPKRNVVLYNQNIDGIKVYNKDFNYVEPVVFGLYSGLFALLIDNTIIEEKKKNKVLVKKNI